VAALFSSELGRAVPVLPLVGVLGAAIAGSLSGIALKLGPRQHPFGANAAGAIVGFVVCLAVSFIAREPHPLPHTARALLPLGYLIVVGSIGAYVLYAWLVHQWPLTRISFIAVIVPVIATALGAWVRHEPVTRMSLAGSALVLVGVLLALFVDRGTTLAHSRTGAARTLVVASALALQPVAQQLVQELPVDAPPLAQAIGPGATGTQRGAEATRLGA
jgi:drug/metabolite transporter (DMT)-like permease